MDDAEYDWIICHDGTKGDMAYALECLRCGEIHRVVTPINMLIWSASAEVFRENHAGCQPKS